MKPEDIRFLGFLTIIMTLFHQHASEHQCHFRIVGRLASNRVPSTTIGKFSDTSWVFLLNLFGGLEFDQASQGIAGKLTQ